ncbi:MAG: hypothetical protein GWN58_12615, partial [Anaerolineae bacterium]|nr:hypothetical protein [Anaerolineae bacterium]
APGGRVLREGYERERSSLAWLAGYLEQLEREKGLKFVPRLTLEIAGDHAEYYREDPVGLALLKRLYAKGGHSFGVHFHKNYRIRPHNWVEAPRGTPEVRTRITADHISEVDALIAEVIDTQDPAAIRAVNHIVTGHFLDRDLAQELGFDLLTGGRNEALNLFFDHDVYNPWRPTMSPGAWSLAEELDSPWVLVPQAPVLGAIGEHAPLPPGVPLEFTEGMRSMIWQDLSIPAMQRKLLHLYLEWRHRQRSLDPIDEKIWVFGWHEHTNNLLRHDSAYGNTRNLRDEVQEFVRWLNENFIAGGIAEYASIGEVAQEFNAWEEAHPGQSSFNYPVRERDWEAYPYRLKGLTRELMYAHYEREITAFRDQDVHVHELLKTDGRNWRYEAGRIVSLKPTWPIYLLWSEAGEQTIDVSSALSGTIRCADGETGATASQSGTTLRVTEVPIICTQSGR